MAAKPPKKPSLWVDADKVYESLSRDLITSLEDANASNMQLLMEAVRAAESLADPEHRTQAKEDLRLLRDTLRDVESRTKKTTLDLVDKYEVTRKELRDELNKSLAGHDPASAEAERLRQDYRIRMLEISEQQDSELAEALDSFSEQTKKSTEEAVESIGALVKDQQEARRDYVGKIQGLLRQVRTSAADEKAQWLETRRLRSKENRKKRDEPKKTKEQKMQEELDRLDASLLTRKVLRPLVSGVAARITGAYKGFKKATGIQAVQDFVEAERVRKDRIDELRFEMAQSKRVSSLTESLQAEVDKFKEVDDSTESVKESAYRLSDIVGKLHELQRSAPALLAHDPSTQPASQLLLGNSAAPRIPGQAPSSAHSGSEALTNYLTHQPQKTVSATKSLSVMDALRAKISNFGRRPAPVSAVSAYGVMDERHTREREIRALERLASRTGKKKAFELGLADYLALGTALAAVVFGYVKELLGAGLFTEFLKNLPSIPAMLKTVRAFVSDGFRALLDMGKEIKDFGVRAYRYMSEGIPKLFKNGEILLTRIEGFFGSALKRLEDLPANIGTYFEGKYAMFRDWAKAAKDTVKTAVATVADTVRDSAVGQVAKTVGNTAVKAYDAAKDVVGRVANAATGAAKTGVEFVKAGAQKVSAAARAVKDTLAPVASYVVDKGSEAFQAISKIPDSAIVKRLVSGASAIAKSPVGVFIRKAAGAAGVVDGMYQLYEEANGVPPTPLQLMDLLDPMKLGLTAGHKLNALFKARTGSTLSELMSQQFVSDSERKVNEMMRPTTRAGNTTLNKQTVKPGTPAISQNSQSSAQSSVVRVPAKRAAASTPSSNPMNIPSLMTYDPSAFTNFYGAM